MAGFDIAYKILHLKLKTGQNILSYVLFPASDNYDAETTSKLKDIGFGKRYVSFFPALFSTLDSPLSFTPWLPLSTTEWASVDIDDCIAAVPIDSNFEEEYDLYLKSSSRDVKALILEYMKFFKSYPQEDNVVRIKINQFNTPVITEAGATYSFEMDMSIPKNVTLH